MKTRLAILIAILSLGVPVFAHRLDEYLQALIVSVKQGQIHGSMRLIPGVAVSSAVIAVIDSDGDGTFSELEEQTYGRVFLSDLSLSVDGHALKPRLLVVSFPTLGEMKEGIGEIHIEFDADLPTGGPHRTLVIENHHEPGISVYLMNSLVPQDRDIRVIAQSRNQNQSYFRLDYAQGIPQKNSLLSLWRSRLLTRLEPFAGVPSMFRLGMRHIAEGTDHLLFLIALLLPTPLFAGRSRWDAAGSIRQTLLQILRVVTAFTIGHSVTLALGAWGSMSLPSRMVEILIALSILVSAIHALRPLFPGREPAIAAGFGLVHGLAFATTLQNLGVDPWQRIASILGFNFGIETMQLVVVIAILPSFIVLSRTTAYTAFRVGGALFAGFASVGWILERAFSIPDFLDGLVDRLAQRGAWIAVSFFLISLVLWLRAQAQSNRSIFSEQPAQPTLEGV